MKSLVVCALVAVVGMVLAIPQNAQNVQPVQLLRYDSDNGELGTYSFAYEQSDGQRRDEDGELRNAGSNDAFVAVKGSYSWIGPDGVNYAVNYIADENGYQPTIPRQLGVPSAVVASLLG